MIMQADMALLTLVDGSVELRDQLKDYQYRGDQLGPMNFLDFMLETYEVPREDKAQQAIIEASINEVPQTRPLGRPLSFRIPYQEAAGKSKKCRIVRQPGHETLPRFVGRWFCRRDDDFEKDLFRASILMLLKPWRLLHELKDEMEMFGDTFDTFMLHADEKCKRVVANIDYYYECSDGAKAERMKAQTNGQMERSGEGDVIGEGVEIVYAEGEARDEDMTLILEEITDEDIERALLMRTHPRERLYGESAVALGYDFGFFNENDLGVVAEYTARKAQPDERFQITAWETQLKAITREQMKTTGVIGVSEEGEEVASSVLLGGSDIVMTPAVHCVGDRAISDREEEGRNERPQLRILNEEQRRAHDIIEERLQEHMTSE